MRPSRIALAFVAAAVALSACARPPVPTPAPTVLSAADTAAIIRAALSEYRTTNGPIVHVVETIRCDRLQCPAGSADPVLSRFATEREARVVSVDEPLPACRWNSAPPAGATGLRLQVWQPRQEEGVTSIGLATTCSEDPLLEHEMNFHHGIMYRVERSGTTWRVAEILFESIT